MPAAPPPENLLEAPAPGWAPMAPPVPLPPERGAGGWRDRGRGAAWRVHATTAALWVLIAVAGAGGVRGLLAGPAPAPAPAAAPDSGTATGAGGFAQSYVAAYLEAGAGQEATLLPFSPVPATLTGITPATRYVDRTAAVSTVRLAPGSWAVEVAAGILAAVPGGYARAGTSYYDVGIATSGGHFVATSLPALTPPPTPAPLPRLATAAPTAPPSGATGEALEAFFSAYLAGQGPVAAEEAPGSRLGAFAAAPFASATVVAAAFGPVQPAAGGPRRRPATRAAEVEVAAADAGGRLQFLDYSLHLAASPAGGWRVAAVLPAAALAQATRQP